MLPYLRKFVLLMWKNWLVRRRHLVFQIFQIVCVVAIIGMIYTIRYFQKVTYSGFQNGHLMKQPISPYVNIVCPTEDRTHFAYSPTSPLLHRMLTTSCRENVTIIEFDTKAELSEKISTDKKFVSNLRVALEFSDSLLGVNGSENVPDEIEVVIRLPHKIGANDENWYTDRLYPYSQNTRGSDGAFIYMSTMFYMLQTHITLSLVYDGEINFNNLSNYSISYANFPSAGESHDEFFAKEKSNVVKVLNSVILLFIYEYLIIIKVIALEKERQLKESMKVMGLPGCLQWSCWFLQAFIVNTICVTFLLCVTVNVDPPMFLYSDSFILFMFFFLYSCTLITFAFLLSTLFAKSSHALVFGCIIYTTLLTFPFFFTVNNDEEKGPSVGTVWLCSLLSSSGLGFGLQIIFRYEKRQEGVNWSNVGTNPMPLNVSLQDIMLFFVLDAILYMCLALYLEKIYPGEYGIPQPFYFLCLPSYWCPGRKNSEMTDAEQPSKSNQKSFEQITDHRPVGIQLMNLSKSFGSHQAVRNVTLELYEGHLTVLVGHNGAGKTTTLNMITGMIPPSAGTVYVNGYDVRKNPGKVRDSMGLCLEHNVLFDELTVTEHLYFFARMKGMNANEAHREIDMYLKALQLEDKRKSFPKMLSGGMKRKLSVAIALCGQPKVVILDEPTTGMDPSSRRQVWNLLQQLKGDRTILLTTHFMDEADVLGDRVAIMASGEVQCCGSSFFLKQQFKTGYYLVLDVSPRCQPDRITAVLRNDIPTVELHSYVGSELTYHLPGSESPKFEALLGRLESSLGSLEIRSFGVSVATLEDVFMKVAVDYDATVLKMRNERRNQKENNNKPQDEYWSGAALIANQALAMFLKRSLSSLRHWSLLLAQIFSPGLVFLFTLMLLDYFKGGSKDTDWPLLNLTLDSYSSPITLLAGDKELDIYRIYKDVLKGHKLVEVDSIEEEIIAQETNSRDNVKMHYIVAASFNNTSAIAWFNKHPVHAAPLSLALVLNALYHSFNNRSISFVNHPLPLTVADVDEDDQQRNIGAGQHFSLIVLLSTLTVVVAFVIIFYIKERASCSKQLQVTSGVNILVFWLTSFLWDLIVLFLMLCVVIVIIVVYPFESFENLLGCLAVLFFSFFLFVLVVTYLLSILLKTPSTGFLVLYNFGISTGLVGMLLVGLPRSAQVTLHFILILTPFGSLSLGLTALLQQHMYNKLDICDKKPCENFKPCCDLDNCFARTVDRIGDNVIFSLILFVVLSLFLLVQESGGFTHIVDKIWRKPRPPESVTGIDSDVSEEINKVKDTPESTLYNSYVLVLRDLTKYYRKVPAVKGICLAVKRGECFGLIGENGAGKTTTFKMITGETLISYGDAIIGGLSIRRNRKTVQKQIGYCPQFDALLDYLTPRETLRIFALIRGVTWTNCQPLIENLAEEFDFSKYLDKRVKTLSSGNKRKVSASLAVLADPPLIYLDEPSSGMDPAAKRHLWSSLIKLRDGGKCIIFTSQSMEEAEALCTRVTIMVNGSFQCLGSTQRLKNKFAQACRLKIKVTRPADQDKISAIDSYVRKEFPKVELKERFQEMLSYEIGGSMAWSRMFGTIERSKRRLAIEEYSLGQCSLEEV